MGLAAVVGIADSTGDIFVIRLVFGKSNRFGAAGNAGYQGKIVTVAAHHFNQEGMAMFIAVSTPMVMSEPWERLPHWSVLRFSS